MPVKSGEYFRAAKERSKISTTFTADSEMLKTLNIFNGNQNETFNFFKTMNMNFQLLKTMVTMISDNCVRKIN